MNSLVRHQFSKKFHNNKTSSIKVKNRLINFNLRVRCTIEVDEQPQYQIPQYDSSNRF